MLFKEGWKEETHIRQCLEHIRGINLQTSTSHWETWNSSAEKHPLGFTKMPLSRLQTVAVYKLLVLIGLQSNKWCD